MKKKVQRPEEIGGKWLNAMCEVLKGGVLAGVTAILAISRLMSASSVIRSLACKTRARLSLLSLPRSGGSSFTSLALRDWARK